MAKLIFGCGYLGSRVARRWREAGQTVFVVTRRGERAAELAASGYQPLVADVTQPDSLADLPPAETVLFAVGYDRHSGRTIDEVYVEGLRHALDALPNTCRRIVYISSTGVYGQNDGSWVDETSACEPQREGGRACLAAERLLLGHRLAHAAVVLRMAGLYGPGRIPHLGSIRSGQPVAAPSRGHLNLIHIEDAALAVLAAEARARPPEVYCVSDGCPVQRGTYLAEVARQLAAPSPNFASPPVGSPALLRAASDKRVSNRRLIERLALRLRYRSYVEGLRASLGPQGDG